MPELHNHTMSERLEQRARLIGGTTEAEIPYLEQVFFQAEFLGQLLHIARQYLESPPSWPASAPTQAPDQATLWSWERGLSLPDEIASGQVSAVVKHYVASLDQQRHMDVSYRLRRDISALYIALTGQNVPPELLCPQEDSLCDASG